MSTGAAGIIRMIWDFLGSRNLSVFIFVMGITYTAILLLFGAAVPAEQVYAISGLLPFKVLYALFFINLVVCEIKWIPGVLKRCGKPKPPVNRQELRRFSAVEIPVHRFRITRTANRLRRRGYRVLSMDLPAGSPIQRPTDSSDTRCRTLLYGYRGRFSPLGNVLFHLAFLVLLAGIAVSMMFRFEGSARVTEGYRFSGTPGEYLTLSVSPIGSVPSVDFLLERITPRFWGNELLFTDLRADVRLQKGRGSIRLSSPLNIGGADVTINGMGITPLYVLRDGRGRMIDVGYVNLAVFTPGSEDSFRIPGFPHRIFLSFYPDHVVKENGEIVNRSMNPVNPAFSVKVLRGRIPLFSGLLKPGEEAAFEDLRLSFPEFRYWGKFRIVRDPGFPVMWAAFILFGTGLVWRLILYRREVAIVEEKGKIYMYGRSDYHQRLFMESLERIARLPAEEKNR